MKERKKKRKKEMKYEGEINEKKIFIWKQINNWYEKKENWILRKKERMNERKKEKKKERNEVWRRNKWKKYLYENKLITDMKRKKIGY